MTTPLIRVEIVEHREQRYDTCGDWTYTPDYNGIVVRVSRMPSLYSMMLVAIHEIVEALLCYRAGISEQAVTGFDKEWLADADGVKSALSEPGDAPDAPYRREHCFAVGIERLVCAELGINWADYEDEIDNLGDR